MWELIKCSRVSRLNYAVAVQNTVLCCMFSDQLLSSPPSVKSTMEGEKDIYFFLIKHVVKLVATNFDKAPHSWQHKRKRDRL